MIIVQFSGDLVRETFDADDFMFDGDFILLSKDGKGVAAIRAAAVQTLIRKAIAE